jgi:hypothetical protein
MLPNNSPAVAAQVMFAVSPGKLPEVLVDVDQRAGNVEARLMVLANGYAATFLLSGPREAVKETVNVLAVELARSLAGEHGQGEG